MKRKKLPILRIVLTIAFALAFVLFTIYIINLAQGRQFNGDGSITETSILRVKSSPADVDIYINGQKANKVDDRVEGIVAGNVNVKITRSGYTPWEKTMEIAPGIVKDITVQLFPEALKLTNFVNSNVDDMYFGPKGDYIFYTVLDKKTPTETGIWKVKISKSLIDFSDGKPEKIVDFTDSFIDELKKGYTVKINADNSRILLNLTNSKIIYVYDANIKNSRTNITSLIGDYPVTAGWLTNTSLILEKNGLVYEYDIVSNQSTIIKFQPAQVSVFAYQTGTVIYKRSESNLLYKYTNRVSETFSLPSGLSVTNTITNLYLPEDNPDVLIIKADKDLYFVDMQKNYFHKVEGVVRVNNLSEKGLGIIFMKEDGFLYNVTFEVLFSNKQYDVKITKINLMDEGAHAEYLANDRLIATSDITGGRFNIEFMDTDGQNVFKAITGQTIVNDRALVSPDFKDLYVLINNEDKETRNIYRTSLEAK